MTTATPPQPIQTDSKNARKALEQLWAAVGKEIRTHTGNMIAITAADTLETVKDTLLELPRRVASRQIIGVLDECDCVTLEVSLFQVQGEWLERFVLFGNAEQLQGSILPLLAADVLTFLWWTRASTLPPRGKVFDKLTEVADQVIADTLTVNLNERATYALADIAWSRSAPWRELTCQLFDDPEAAEQLPNLERLILRYVDGRRGDQAARFYGAWLASRLGWQNLSRVRLEPIEQPAPNQTVARGEILGVELVAPQANFKIEITSSELASTSVHLPSGSRHSTVKLPDKSLAWLLTFAMDVPEHNDLYRASLKIARDSAMKYEHFADPQAVGTEAAERFVQEYQYAVAARGAFHVALSGGSTPVIVFHALRAKNLDWSKIHWYWSDERSVAPDHAQSNYKLAWDELFSHIGVNPAQVKRMEGELEPATAARRYAEILPEQLDLCYLGMGDDGHTASLFPDTLGLEATGRVVANFVDKLETWRITFTFAEINRSRAVHILATGANKAQILLEVKNRLVKHPIERVESPLWLLDEAAAKLL